jgi:hypothetical protein
LLYVQAGRNCNPDICASLHSWDDVLLCPDICWDGVSWTFWVSWPRTTILPISAPQVVKITGLGYQCWLRWMDTF